jgi:pyruvate formate lyase activating enzyme
MESLERACRLGAKAGLKYVYCGNATGLADERTYCSSCRHVLIDRMGFSVERIAMKDGACPKCGAAAEGVWK